MPDDLFFLDYTVEAIEDSLNIKDFILIKFTPREVDNFYTLLDRFEKVIVLFPLMYPKSLRKSQIRRAVLSKQLSIFYMVFRTNNYGGWHD